MSEPTWERAKAIFAEVSELPVSKRGARLDQLCGDDSEVRAEVDLGLVGKSLFLTNLLMKMPIRDFTSRFVEVLHRVAEGLRPMIIGDLRKFRISEDRRDVVDDRSRESSNGVERLVPVTSVQFLAQGEQLRQIELRRLDGRE